jgi:hypothetical protein
VDPDEIGGFCPQCDAEFRPGITECPDCGIPLVGPAGDAGEAGEARFEPPDGGTAARLLGIDSGWAPRLVVFAVACVATVALQLAGAIVAILSTDGSGGDQEQHNRVRSLVQVVTPGLASILLVAALAVVGARLLGDRRWWARLAVFGAAAALAGLAVVGAVTDVVWRSDNSGNQLAPAFLARAAVLVLVAVAIWLTEPWVVDVEVEA